MDPVQAIVFDNGTRTVKCGFAGDDYPRCVFPSVVGRLTVQPAIPVSTPKDFYVGDDAQARRGILQLQYAMEHGVVTNWDVMEKIFHHMFYNELRVKPEENHVMMTEAPMNPTCNREKMVQIMFETFNVPAVYVGNAGVLSLCASGRTTGVVLDAGEGVTQAVPIVEGCVLRHAIQRSDFAGRDLTDYMARLLTEVGCRMTSPSEHEDVRSLKEKMCHVALDFEEAMSKSETTSGASDKEFMLPDGHCVLVPGSQRFRCAEALFKPLHCGVDGDGVHTMTCKAIWRCPIDVRRDLFSNVVLSGGTTMFRGLPERLSKEIRNLLPSSVIPRVVAAPERQYWAWTGGSILSSLPTFKPMWITRPEYNEAGINIVHNKCSC